MTNVSVNTYAHSVTYLADNILKSFKDILVLSGLDPTNLVDSWETTVLGLKTWLQSEHLKGVCMEIFDPRTDALIYRWDLDVVYGWSSSGDGNFYADTDLLRYHIRKTGLLPSQAKYRLLVDRAAGFPIVAGWSSAEYRSTAGMVKQSLGSAIEHNGLGATAGYWRRN
jgi:hypothetical protein